MKKKLILFVIAIFILLYKAPVYSQTPLGMEDVVWQKDRIHIFSLAFSPTESYVAAASLGDIIIYDIQTGNELKRLKCHNESSSHIVFSNDGKYLFSGDGKGQLMRWDTGTWDSTEFVNYDSGELHIYCIDYNSISNCVAIGVRNSGLELYDAQTGLKIMDWKGMPIYDPKLGYKAVVNSVSFRNDGKVIAIGMGSIDETWLYDIDENRIIKKIKGEDGQYSPTKNELIVKKIKESDGSELLDGLDFYKFDESDEPVNLDIDDFSAFYTKFVFSSDGDKLIVAGAASMKIKIFDLNVFTLINTIEGQDGEPLGGYLAISSDNKYILTLGKEKLYLLKIDKYLSVPESKIQNLKIYPNPSQETMTLEYSLDIMSNLNISISDLQGNNILNLFSGLQYPGEHSLIYSISNLSTGNYFITIESNGQTVTLPFQVNK